MWVSSTVSCVKDVMCILTFLQCLLVAYSSLCSLSLSIKFIVLYWHVKSLSLPLFVTPWLVFFLCTFWNELCILDVFDLVLYWCKIRAIWNRPFNIKRRVSWATERVTFKWFYCFHGNIKCSCSLLCSPLLLFLCPSLSLYSLNTYFFSTWTSKSGQYKSEGWH